MSRHINRRVRVHVGHTIATATIVMAIALTGAACGSSTSDQQKSSATVDSAQAVGPISQEWTDADLETVAERIGYGSNPSSLLARNAEGGLVFIPETSRDHIATRFMTLPMHDGDRSLQLILDVQSPGGESCEASLQDQAFNMLVTVPCRTVGKHEGTAKLSSRVTGMRLYVQSPTRQPVRLPARVQVVERR